MKKEKRHQKSCAEIALTRARQARRQKKHPILIGWAFIAALLSNRSSNSSQNMSCIDVIDHDWPISDYERGYSACPKFRCERYSEQPTLKRLIRDLRRPAAREDAMQFLLARIDDIALRGWIIEQINQDQINRLAIHVRPSLHDSSIIASWQAELVSENTVADEAINETLQAYQPPRH
ncbi:MAG: hypothetical protein LBE54_05635 [Brucellaceae bacterium]|nr:hypothetical protein [Brucellaceae bacterium]